MSEDDIRTKVVYGWLVGSGLLPAEISIEYGFEVRLGRSAYRVGATPPLAETTAGTVARPRCDVLVRRNDQNIMVVEVKAPDESLDDQARDQGISYARLLPQIAPFVVVTNGKQARIYDAVTREELSGEWIPADHPTVRAGFRVTVVDLTLRAEALDWFVSLSPSNLVTFCERQATFRMSRLRDSDQASGKKYIPALYADRPGPRGRLAGLLDESHARVVAVVGRPQVGKTNFLCHFAEERLRQGRPVLFYPFVSLDGGLLDGIAEDFGWVLGDINPASTLVTKLQTVVRRAGGRLTLFIDGWNEADVEVARQVDRACERLACPEIQVVISFTHSAARRLLTQSGNPSFIAEETGVRLGGIDLIETDPGAAGRQREWAVVAIEPYSEVERQVAYRLYGRHFDVAVPESHQPTKDPYLLGVAMRHFTGQTLPDLLDEPNLIGAWLDARINRIDPVRCDPRAALTAVACEMLRVGCPVGEQDVKRCWGMPAVEPISPVFFEAALLAPQGVSGPFRNIDFYNSRDRDYVIACWAGRWTERIGHGGDYWAGFADVAKTNAGADALAWFFRQSAYLERLLNEDQGLPQVADANLRRLFLDSVGRLTRRTECVGDAGVWRQQCVELAKSDSDMRCRIEAVKLLVALIEDGEDLLAVIPPSDDGENEMLRGILEVHEDYPIEPGGAGQVILDAFRDWHIENGCGEEGSFLVDALRYCTRDESAVVREGARSAWGYLAPRDYITALRESTPGGEIPTDWAAGLHNAIGSVVDQYNGDPYGMCPSFLDSLENDPDGIEHEYCTLRDILTELSAYRNADEFTTPLREMFDTLAKMMPAEERERLEGPEVSPDVPRCDAPGQLYLFDRDV